LNPSRGNIEAFRPKFLHFSGGDVGCLVGGIVENLDLQTILGVIELPDSLQQAADHKVFIENRQLDGDFRQLGEFPGGFWRGAPVLQEQVNDRITVEAVGRQSEKHRQIADTPQCVVENSV
jgi:hypothetical protein